ncbi:MULTISPECIES: hypothetical protein [unclassified Mesorhizobium]|uniref:hypothetical protein n=1 Tax=unclassified Mesorhizobium TaxID=325217 RepID=UPI000FCA614C|nr:MULTISPECIES: hypothetical protein [unclassified Mesorhizobium]RUV54176.1 hypothetical protein EOA85_25885 [Mesorhizobium sp. M5C.F.Ca.IN.020.29.1.1]RWA95905.1 MAG: hypothetical protein EOQ33_34245 [Mesorhizobium sp.]RWB97213.1 MAG: hypothetical protein EOS51_32425 [Mesorhizobium sp.]RWD74374.1 MAG: hypothetical protein EOS48_32645 [Mesorhizobium sp.]RWE51762.1 MAG: hypothetical protein EOS67_31890 [Mesorhizobium sp.]
MIIAIHEDPRDVLGNIEIDMARKTHPHSLHVARSFGNREQRRGGRRRKRWRLLIQDGTFSQCQL